MPKKKSPPAAQDNTDTEVSQIGFAADDSIEEFLCSLPPDQQDAIMNAIINDPELFNRLCAALLEQEDINNCGKNTLRLPEKPGFCDFLPLH